MIAIEAHDGRHCAIVRCDVCGERIEDVREGLVGFQSCPIEIGKPRPAYHAHKSRCRDKLEERIGAGYGDLELSEHLFGLMLNCRCKVEDFQRIAACPLNNFPKGVFSVPRAMKKRRRAPR